MRTKWWLKLIGAEEGALALLSACALAACAPTERVLGDDSAGSAGVGPSAGSDGSGAIAGSAGSGGSTAIARSAGIGGNTGIAGDMGNAGTSAGAGSCVVAGKIYPNGSSLKDPFSCNNCTCDNGSLSCTDIGCEVPCPVGTAPGTQCLQCGPMDACLSREYKCLPTCTDQVPCADGDYCVSGTCHLATGVCG